MTIQLSSVVRTAMVGAIEPAIAASPILKFRSGAQPASTSAADSGTVIATIPLAADWAAAAAAGAVALSGMPLQDLSADAAGTIAHYRLYAADGVTCHMQGSVASSGTPDMTIDNAVVALGQQINVTAWSINMAGHQ
jgi:hypothetical protein